MGAPAKPAASLLLIRDGRDDIEVLMIKRAETMRFAPGSLVFPGGRVDAQDFAPYLYRFQQSASRRMKDRAFRLAALRETYEEVGLLAALEAGRGNVQDYRRAVGQGRLVPDLRALVPFAHWVTPEPMPVRFDTHFYLTAAPSRQIARHDGMEAVDHRWISPKAILADWELDAAKLMFPTRMTLIKLARANSVRAAIRFARREPVVRTLPTIRQGDTGPIIEVGPETLQPELVAHPRDLSAEAPASRPGVNRDPSRGTEQAD